MGENFFDNAAREIESDLDNRQENLDVNINLDNPDVNNDSVEENFDVNNILNQIGLSEDQLIKKYGEDIYKKEIVPILIEHHEEIKHQFNIFSEPLEEKLVEKNDVIFWKESNDVIWDGIEKKGSDLMWAEKGLEPLQINSIDGINNFTGWMNEIGQMDALGKFDLIIKKLKIDKQLKSLDGDNRGNIDIDSISFIQEVFITTETKGINSNIKKYLLNPQNKEDYLAFRDFYLQDKSEDFWENKDHENIFDTIKTDNISINDIKFSRTYYKYLEHLESLEQTGGKPLSEEQKAQKEYLKILFNDVKKHTLVYNRRNRLLERRGRPRLLLRDVKITPESNEVVSGDLSSLRPQDIVRGNDSIRRYIFGEKPDPEDILGEKPRSINNINDIENREDIFNEVIGWEGFADFKIYFNKLGNLEPPNDKPLSENEIITLKRVEKDIHESMVHLARQRQFSEKRKEVRENVNESINERSVRTSCMVCCIRAITSYFDTVNNNGENFAGLFKMDDINKNIEFKEDGNGGGVLSMEGSINGRHLKIYYDTSGGTIYFDKFLGTDDSGNFVIGKNNGEKEEVITGLPTMEKLQKSANSTFLWFGGDITAQLGPRNRAKISTFLMTEHIWHKQFLTLNFDVNRKKVKEFNEKNLLTQEILYDIYGHYYDENVVEEMFNGENNGNGESNQTRFIVTKGSKQYEMVQLISNSIEHYSGDANALMRFRNCIEDLHDILEIINNNSGNNTLVPQSRQEDNVLRDFFIDDHNNPNDKESVSNHIMSTETGRIAGDFNSVYTESIVHNNIENEDSRDLNYHTFLCLLSRNTFVGSDGSISNEDSFIDVKEFENVISYIRGGGNNISNYVNKNNQQSIFAQNYKKYTERQEKREADDLLANTSARDSNTNIA